MCLLGKTACPKHHKLCAQAADCCLVLFFLVFWVREFNVLEFCTQKMSLLQSSGANVLAA